MEKRIIHLEKQNIQLLKKIVKVENIISMNLERIIQLEAQNSLLLQKITQDKTEQTEQQIINIVKEENLRLLKLVEKSHNQVNNRLETVEQYLAEI